MGAWSDDIVWQHWGQLLKNNPGHTPGRWRHSHFHCFYINHLCQSQMQFQEIASVPVPIQLYVSCELKACRSLTKAQLWRIGTLSLQWEGWWEQRWCCSPWGCLWNGSGLNWERGKTNQFLLWEFQKTQAVLFLIKKKKKKRLLWHKIEDGEMKKRTVKIFFF